MSRAVKCRTILSVLIAILILLDGIATVYGIENSYITELNPLALGMFNLFDVFTGVLIFTAIAMISLIFVAVHLPTTSWFMRILVGVFVVRFSVVLIHVHWLIMEGYIL